MTADPKTPQQRMSRQRFLTSPLVHFFAIGGLIFAVYALMDDRPDIRADAITLTAGDARQMAEQFESGWNRPPTADEMTQLMQAWVEEEALVREAVALGMDQGDAVIRQRLNIKMRFLAELQAGALIPDEETLQTYLDQNSDKFAIPPRIAFRQVFLPDEPDTGIVAIKASLNAGDDPMAVGAASLLPHDLPLTGALNIDGMFGSGFAQAVQAMPDGQWAGPVDSSYGRHLVMITQRSDGGLPPLDQIRPRVEAEWRATQAAQMREALGRELLGRYQVDLPDVNEVLSE